MAKQRAPRVRLPANLPAIQLVAPLALLASLGVVLPTAAIAEVVIKPSVIVRETYSDNPSLSVDNSDGAFITDVSPSVNMVVNGPRLKGYANVAGHLYAYAGGQPNNTNSSSLQLSSGGKATVVNDLLYVDGAAGRSRQSVSAFGQQAQNDYSNTNSDTITTWRLSPYLVHRFGNFASGQLRYTHDSVKSSRNLLSNSQGDSADLNLASGPIFSTIGWDLQAHRQKVDDPLAGESTLDNAIGTLRYRLKQSLSLYVNGGYDRYMYEGLGGTTGGKSFAGGFTWTPSQRTSIDASIGRRYFGKTYSLAATVRSRRTIWNANYRDEITTARAQFLRPGSIDTAGLLDASFAAAFPDPVERRQAILAYLAALGLPTTVANNVNYFSNRLLLQKQFQASVVLKGVRSSLIASFSNTRRNALSPAGVDAAIGNDIAIGGLLDNTRQSAVTLALNYRLSSRSAATLSSSKSRSVSVATGIEQDQTTVGFTVTHQFARNLSGNVDLRRNQGSALDANNRTYRENAISATLNYQL
jgi:uncharacterized protein (PEP-CTERM system associated)